MNGLSELKKDLIINVARIQVKFYDFWIISLVHGNIIFLFGTQFFQSFLPHILGLMVCSRSDNTSCFSTQLCLSASVFE